MEKLSEALLTFLVNGVWQIAIIVALAALASLILRNGPAHYRHLIWTCSLVACIIVPGASAIRDPLRHHSHWTASAVSVDTPGGLGHRRGEGNGGTCDAFGHTPIRSLISAPGDIRDYWLGRLPPRAEWPLHQGVDPYTTHSGQCGSSGPATAAAEV